MTANPVRPVSELDFDAEVLRASVPVLVDFATRWCSPCHALAPILKELATEHAGRLKVVTVDAEEQPGLAARYRITGFPTILAFASGQVVARRLGLTSKAKLLRWTQSELRLDATP